MLLISLVNHSLECWEKWLRHRNEWLKSLKTKFSKHEWIIWPVTRQFQQKWLSEPGSCDGFKFYHFDSTLREFFGN